MKNLEKKIVKDITKDFLEKIKSEIFSESELKFFSYVCIAYLRKELNKNLELYLCKIFKKESIRFISNIDYIINYKQCEQNLVDIVDLDIEDIVFILNSDNLIIIYNYKIDKINNLVEDTLNNIKIS